MKAIFSFLFLSFFITSAFASNQNNLTAKADTDINIPAPDFSLKDLNGKTVSLADYKGKTLIIDFWATWCVPCRESFPAVKMVMDKYKNDPDVKFLFIDTREKVADFVPLIKKFLADNQYPFYVVLDETGPDGKMDKTYLKYVMPGIPTKYIIDKKGIIRFKHIGFVPDQKPEDAAKDVEADIETIKKQGS